MKSNPLVVQHDPPSPESATLDLPHPTTSRQIRGKAAAILEDLDNWRACVNSVAERYGWYDPYVLDGLATIDKFEDVRRVMLERLAA